MRKAMTNNSVDEYPPDLENEPVLVNEMGLLDPVHARILGRAFEAICAEMGSAMIATAVSAVFVEGRDFSCAVLDHRGELVASANFDPSHLSAMALTAEYALMELGWESLEEGDVIVVNDPYRGGGHLPDISIIRPIYCEGELLGLAMNRGHHVDVGGMAVGGFPGTARSIFQEGLRIPPVKWYERSIERYQLMDLVLLNLRFPRETFGDFRAQLASCMVAERRMRELVERHGIDDILLAMQETKNYSERLMRISIDAISDGSYSFKDVMDDDGVGNGPYEIAVELRVAGDEVTADFTGTSGQAMGPINSSYGNTVGSVFNAFLHTFGSEIPFNHGCFRPVTIIAPRGCFLNPIPPAPTFGGVTETSIRIIDAVMGALNEVVPDRVAAGSYGTCVNFAGGGWDDERHCAFGFYFFQEGGWGGTSWRDGWTSVPNPTSNFMNYPAEVVESILPVRCIEVALNEDSAGAGTNRGGFGTRHTFEILAEHCEVNALGDRFVTPPFGLSNGLPGTTSQTTIQRVGAERPMPFHEAFDVQSPSKFLAIHLARGDRFSMITGGGGGFGDPYLRPTQLVLEDVREGLISVDAARNDYGVMVTGEGINWRIDEVVTTNLRAKPSPRHTVRVYEEPVPSYSLSGPEADDVARVQSLVATVRVRMGPDPCTTVCPKQGDPVRCPFHHPFATQFWDAASLERWATRNCPIVQAERFRARAPKAG
jgi:N-methylhydantoinase B/oxoprolinase/acetone carboxylase alpha subunit